MITPIADVTPRSVVASIFLLITGIKKASVYAGFRDGSVWSNYKKCTDALTNSVHSSGWTTRDPSASGLCQNDGLQAVVVWQLRLHTSHISEQPEGKHRLRILLE